MSIIKIARFLKINQSLYGVQSEDERRMVLPGSGVTGRAPIYTGLLSGGKCDPRSRMGEVAMLGR